MVASDNLFDRPAHGIGAKVGQKHRVLEWQPRRVGRAVAAVRSRPSPISVPVHARARFSIDESPTVRPTRPRAAISAWLTYAPPIRHWPPAGCLEQHRRERRADASTLRRPSGGGRGRGAPPQPQPHAIRARATGGARSPYVRRPLAAGTCSRSRGAVLAPAVAVPRRALAPQISWASERCRRRRPRSRRPRSRHRQSRRSRSHKNAKLQKRRLQAGEGGGRRRRQRGAVAGGKAAVKALTAQPSVSRDVLPLRGAGVSITASTAAAAAARRRRRRATART